MNIRSYNTKADPRIACLNAMSTVSHELFFNARKGFSLRTSGLVDRVNDRISGILDCLDHGLELLLNLLHPL
ncbi:hypothetical protein LLE87_27005, partial [Paenibacillus polymyxa]|nr:hypothetical protein [Paenibacillus polymyxa]